MSLHTKLFNVFIQWRFTQVWKVIKWGKPLSNKLISTGGVKDSYNILLNIVYLFDTTWYKSLSKFRVAHNKHYTYIHTYIHRCVCVCDHLLNWLTKVSGTIVGTVRCHLIRLVKFPKKVSGATIESLWGAICCDMQFWLKHGD